MTLSPPVAREVPRRLVKHGHVRIDDYYWLNERDNPDVIRYLEAENRYTDAAMAPTRELQEKIFEEIKTRIKPDDRSVPYLREGYYYYTRFEEGSEYPLYCRKGSLEAPEELLIDAGRLAEGHDYFHVGNWSVSSRGDVLAYATDTVGRRIYTIYIKDLERGTLLEETIPDVTGNLAWANDNRTLFYARQDPRTLRSFQIYRHLLGGGSRDELVYEESDEAFGAYVDKTRSQAFLYIASYRMLSTEYRILDANNPGGEFTIFHPREREVEYRIDHCGDRFLIRTNDQAPNFRLMQTPVSRTGKSNWTEIVPHREDVLLEDFQVFDDFLVLEERRKGLIRLRVKSWKGDDDYYIDFDEPAYLAFLQDNYELDTKTLRYGYSSLTTPHSVFDFDMTSRDRKLMKQDEVPGGFLPEHYRTERLEAASLDGQKVPVSVVYKKTTPPDGRNPLLLYGYGAYGISLDASFNPALPSLLDRGFTFAMAHVRGGQELGRRWYEEGRLLKKKNTFTDFIDCAEYLVSAGYSARDKLFAMGGSAGGLLVAAALNMRPRLFRGIVAQVPFVDVVTTMLDATVPLTTGEYDQWGDPNRKEFYEYILSYSPYDNVALGACSDLLVTAGFHDSQVQYWEPTKWVAKLRKCKGGNALILLKVNMDAGHHGVSGRFRRYRERALEYAFLLDRVGIEQA